MMPMRLANGLHRHLYPSLLLLSLLGYILFTLPAALAATYPLKEIPAGPAQTTVPMKWQASGPRASSVVEGGMVAPLHLDTARWLGRQGRVYISLPPQPIGPVRVRWTTRGTLLPGQLLSGERGLLYSGTLPASLKETLTLTIEANGDRLSRSQRLEFNFEIDVE